MKSSYLIVVTILLANFTFAQENEPKALPEIPSLSIDMQKQPDKELPKTPLAQPSTLAIPQKELQSNQNATQTTNAMPLTEESTENNETKKNRDPFTPIITPKISGQITNAPQLDLFTKTELILPSTARKIKKITLEYQNLNGSISSIEQNLEGDIDWHFPLVLSQEVQPEAPKVLDKQSFMLGNLFDFEIAKQNIKLKTSLKRLRDFTLASPTRLVLDFQAPNKTTLQETFDSQIPSIPTITLSTHLDFYRITFSLDGQYKYKITQISSGNYTIELY